MTKKAQRNVLPTFHPPLNPTSKWLLHLLLSGPQPKSKWQHVLGIKTAGLSHIYNWHTENSHTHLSSEEERKKKRTKIKVCTRQNQLGHFSCPKHQSSAVPPILSQGLGTPCLKAKASNLLGDWILLLFV